MSVRFIVEADGGARGNPGPAAYGAVVRDAGTGQVLAEAGEAIGVATNNVAEYRGLIAGLMAARAIRPDAAVDVRLDSKLIVEQMSGRWKIKNPVLRPLAMEASRIFPRNRVTYQWVPRAQNKHADRLVNEALDGNPAGPPAQPGAGATLRKHDEGGESSGKEASARLPVRTQLFVVRHGQTSMTTAGIFSGGGVPGPPLNDAGRQEAARAADLLASSGAVAVVASPLVRARQTADAIAAKLGVEVHEDEDLRECDFGLWEGHTFTEMQEKYPEAAARWFRSLSAAPPEGESLEALAQRVTMARDRLVKRYDQQAVIVVTHSLVIRTLLRLALEAAPAAMWRVQPAPGSVTEIQAFPDGEWALKSFSTLP